MENMKFHDVELEKKKVCKLQRIGNLFKVVEFMVFLYVVSKFSSEVSVFNLSGEWVRGAWVIIFSPGFVFIIVNVIIIILVVGSGKLSDNQDEKVIDYYDEYVKKRSISRRKAIKTPEFPDFHSEKNTINERDEKLEQPEPQKAKIPALQSEKKIIITPTVKVEDPEAKVEKIPALQSEKKIITTPTVKVEDPETKVVKIPDFQSVKKVPTTQVEKLKKPGFKIGRGLEYEKYSVSPKSGGVSTTKAEEINQDTEMYTLKAVETGKKPSIRGVPSMIAEELSGDELRLKADAFIERQRRFLMGEE